MSDDRRNAPIHRTAYILYASTSNPIPAGSVGQWYDGTTIWNVAADGSQSAQGEGEPEYAPVDAVSDANIAGTYDSTALTLTVTATGALTVDGVTASLGKRILLTNQTTHAEEGIYEVTTAGALGVSPVLTRADDLNASAAFISGAVVAAKSGGTTYGSTLWVLGFSGSFTLDTTRPLFVQTATAVTEAAVRTALAALTASASFNNQALTAVKSVTKKASTTLTIAAGVVTATQAIHAIDTEAAAASDDLDTINGLVLGETYLFELADATHNVVFKHGTGNIRCDGGEDLTLDVAADVVIGFYDGTNLLAFPGSLATIANGGLAARLASTATGKGASVVGIEDSASLITATTVEAALAELAARTGALSIADPGNAGAIPVTQSGVCPMTSAGVETRTIAIPTFIGQRLVLTVDTYVGDVAVTASQAINETGNTIMTFGSARDAIELVGITVGGALRWQVGWNDGCTLS